MTDTQREQWLKKHGLPKNDLDRFNNAAHWWDPIKTMLDLQVMLTCVWEFYVDFRGEEYFISSEHGYRVYLVDGDELIYKSDDLDDFGENARIGEDGEFLLKDVIKELVFE